jgi:carbamoyltransferase
MRQIAALRWHESDIICNARILRDTPFKQSYIQYAASDDRTSIGVSLYVWNAILDESRVVPIDHAYWGPAYSEKEMEEVQKAKGRVFERFERPALFDRAAVHLNADNVVGWYQSPSECGPRALGYCSILAHLGWTGMKELINQKIKRREAFRPFGPTILADAVPDYFEKTVESPCMMHVLT